jgi:hypothetical protein
MADDPIGVLSILGACWLAGVVRLGSGPGSLSETASPSTASRSATQRRTTNNRRARRRRSRRRGRSPHTQSGRAVSPTPSTGSDVMPDPSARITKSPGAENTMWVPLGDHAGVYARLCVSRFTPDPSGRIT